MQMTNDWNRIIYRLWAPIYDQSVNQIFMPGRRRALELLGLRPGERVLIVGVGTGADLPLLAPGTQAVGIDLSPEMLNKARQKLADCPAGVTLFQADAQSPLTRDSSFDAAILNLILSVIPDANACLRTTLRALKPGGRIVVFDKFLPEGRHVSPFRKLLNTFSKVLGTDINRRLSDIMKGCPCTVLSNEASILDGMYRVILLCKTEE